MKVKHPTLKSQCTTLTLGNTRTLFFRKKLIASRACNSLLSVSLPLLSFNISSLGIPFPTADFQAFTQYLDSFSAGHDPCFAYLQAALACYQTNTHVIKADFLYVATSLTPFSNY